MVEVGAAVAFVVGAGAGAAEVAVPVAVGLTGPMFVRSSCKFEGSIPPSDAL